MAWRAYLVAIRENPVPNDTAFIDVRFDDVAQGRTLSRDYKLVAGTTLADMRAMVRDDLQKMNAFDTIKSNIQALVGQEIT